MPNDKKPSRMFTVLIEDRKELRGRVAAMEAEAARFEDRIQAAIDATALADKQEHEEAMARVKHQHDADWSHAAHEREGLLETIRDLRAQLEAKTAGLQVALRDCSEATSKVAQFDGQRRELQEYGRELAATAEGVARQRTELAKILDTVRARMRRKELAEEQAILNRQALARAAPKRNWG